MFKVNNRNSRIKSEINSKLTIKTDVVLVFSTLTLAIFHAFFSVYIVDFEKAHVSSESSENSSSHAPVAEVSNFI